MTGHVCILQASSWPVEETCTAQVINSTITTGVWSGSGLDESVCTTLVDAIERSWRGHRHSGRVAVHGRTYDWTLHRAEPPRPSRPVGRPAATMRPLQAWDAAIVEADDEHDDASRGTRGPAAEGDA